MSWKAAAGLRLPEATADHISIRPAFLMGCPRMGPTGYTSFRRQLDLDAELAAELRTVNGDAQEYSVVLLALDERGKWATVRVYDNHLGIAHLHRYTRGGGKQQAEKIIAATPSDEFNMALQEAERGYREMIEAWRRS
jgi:hypothetical protein